MKIYTKWLKLALLLIVLVPSVVSAYAENYAVSQPYIEPVIYGSQSYTGYVRPTVVYQTQPIYTYYTSPSYNYNYSPVNAYCYPDISTADVGQTVTWRSSVTGGNGYPSYSWNGTDGVYSTDVVATRAYNDYGTKTASVTVTSGGQTVVRNCGTVEIRPVYSNYTNNNYASVYAASLNYYGGPLTASCSANLTNTFVGNRVVWSAYVTGGSGPYTYSWSGTDNLSYYNSSLSTITTQYTTSGTKYVTVTVRSGNQVSTQLCGNSLMVAYPTTSVAQPTPTVTRQVTYDVAPTNTTTKQALDVVCTPNIANASIGDSVAWTANASGGSSTNYSYVWSGSDGISSLNNTAFKTYSTAGIKNASVTVSSGKDTITKSCTNTVVIGTLSQTAAATFSLDQIPWGLVSVLIIMILVGSLIYVISTRPKVQK